MGGFYIVLAIVVWVIVALWPARVASRKGYNFLLFFLLSLPFFIITLILAYVMPDKTKQKTVQAETEA